MWAAQTFIIVCCSLGAKDLPRTVLSDHIEDRLFKRLKQEKKDHGAVAGKSIDEVSDTVQLLQDKNKIMLQMSIYLFVC
jgi:hypothetical protein